MSKIPVFIVGINPRSGTNYLFNLLSIHPECTVSKHYGEDFILYGIDHFSEFTQKVTFRWKKEWKNDPELFKQFLSDGIIKYLDPEESDARYVLTKTPDPTNADRFLETFEKGYLIIITRNGQDLVESFVLSFRRRFEDAVRGWLRGARWIVKIINDKEYQASDRVLILKYEDLYLKNVEVMTRILDFLGLDVAQYDFSKSLNMDVIGSSTFKRNSQLVDWTPVSKDESFNPINRSKEWNRFKHYRFNWLAGKYSKALGYELKYESNSPVYYIYNLILTVYNFFFRLSRRTNIILKAAVKNRKELKRALQVEYK